MSTESRKLTIHFGVKDRDISPRMKGVQKGVFSFVIKAMIRAYLADEEECDLGSLLDDVVENPGTFGRNLSMGKDDEDVYQFIMSQDESCRADTVKAIIRKYLNKRTSAKNNNIIQQKPHEEEFKKVKEEKLDNEITERETKNSEKKTITLDDIKTENVSEEDADAIFKMYGQA